MFEATGKNTGKVYATGSKADCFRKLKEEYPTYRDSNKNKLRGRKVEQIYPEELLIIRRKK